MHLLNNSYFLKMGLVQFSGLAVLNMIHLPGGAFMAKNGQGTFFQNIDAMHCIVNLQMFENFFHAIASIPNEIFCTICSSSSNGPLLSR